MPIQEQANYEFCSKGKGRGGREKWRGVWGKGEDELRVESWLGAFSPPPNLSLPMLHKP